MAFQPVPQTASIAIHTTLFGQSCVNIVYAQKSDAAAWTLAELTGTANAVRAAYVANVLPHLAADLFMGAVVATDISRTGGLQAVDTTSVGTPGGIPSDTLPGNVTFVVKFTTGHVGRSYRGRNYIPGIPTQVQVENAVSATFADQMVAGYVAIRNALTADLRTMVHVSRTQDGVTPAVALALPITNISYTDLILDSQRRRLTGRGA